MNKDVPTILTMSALLFAAGCSSSGSSHLSYSGVRATHASYTTQAQTVCPTCAPGYHAVAHVHNNQVGNALQHSHASASGHAHNGYSAGYGYRIDADVTAGRNLGVSASVESNNSGGSGGSALVKIAGALLVGGLIYNATKDDDAEGEDTPLDKHIKLY